MISKKFVLVIFVVLLGWSLIGVGYADITNKYSITEDKTAVDSEVVDKGVNSEDQNLGPARSTTLYYPTVTLQYDYGGETYTTEEELEQYKNTKEGAKNLVDNNFDNGSTVEIYLSPNNPEEIQETPSTNFVPYSFISIGSLIFLFTLMILNRARK